MSAKGPELEIGATIPGTKYQVVKALGAGGMGVVYQVVKPPNIQGVLKLMSSDLSRHEEHRVRFFDEVRILAQLDHPNIVRVFDYDSLPDGTPFYVMELLSGRTVRDVIYTMGRVPPRVAYEITRQLLEALQAAHTHEVPVIHRDIKPENIFLHAPRHGEPVVKLIDFGVSSVADRKHDGAFVGTWSYASPEQIRGAKPTPASDLYAVGLVLYEMLAGVGPFDHYDDWTRVSKAQLEEIPAPVSKFAPWVPASIVTLIQSALAKDPRVRPHDAYAFAERLFELEWASDGKDPHDQTAEGPSLDARPQSHPQRAVGAAAAAGAAVAGAAAAARAGLGPVQVGGSGPLSKVLSTITSTSRASSKNLAAASPATDRLGDVPLIGVPPESVRSGPTWRGVGGREHTSPDADALLAGLGVVGGKPPSKRERESNPDAEMSPRPGQVVIKAGRHASSPHDDDDAPTAPRVLPRGPAQPGTAVTLDEVPASAPAPTARDTFSSQSSDARRALPRSRTGLFVLSGALLLIGLVTATVVVVRGSSSNASTSTTSNHGAATTPAETATVPTTTAAPPAAAAAAAEPTTPPESELAPATTTAPAASTKPGHKPSPAAKTASAPATAAPATAAPATTTTTTGATPTSSSTTGNKATPAPNGTSSGDFIRHF